MEIINDGNLSEKAQKILEIADLPERHSKFQIKNFIINSEPTLAARIWQIAREIDVRLDSIGEIGRKLLDVEDEIELVKLEIEEIDRQIKRLSQSNESDNDLLIAKLDISIRKKTRAVESMAKSGQKMLQKKAGIEEELMILVQAFEELNPKYDKVVNLDDEAAQTELWDEKLLAELNVKLLFNQKIDTNFVHNILSMADGSKAKEKMILLINDITKRKSFKIEGK